MSALERCPSYNKGVHEERVDCILTKFLAHPIINQIVAQAAKGRHMLGLHAAGTWSGNKPLCLYCKGGILHLCMQAGANRAN